MKFPYPGIARIRRATALLLTFQYLLVAACDAPPIAADEPPVADTAFPGCEVDGQLSAELYGGIRATLAWSADVLDCDGMIRPDGEGARLRFSGPLPTGESAEEQRSLAFIFGLPDLQRGDTASELATNVTLFEGGAGRVYGTQDTENCWTDILSQEQIGAENAAEYRITGLLYCVAPLAELNGSSSISFADIKFTGRLSWETPE